MTAHDAWDDGSSYDRFMGRWSLPVAQQFVGWLARPAGSSWLDVGCGTGALTAAIAQAAQPRVLAAVDLSAAFAAAARSRIPLADVRIAEASNLPFPDAGFDAVVSGLALNFFPDPRQAIEEFRRVAKPGGVIAAYVWDYAEGMQMLRVFWDSVDALALGDTTMDEAARFPVCRPDALTALFESAGLDNVTTSSLEAVTEFRDFDDYWTPFQLGQGPAPSFVAALSEPAREQLEKAVRTAIGVRAGASISLDARAWAVCGVV